MNLWPQTDLKVLVGQTDDTILMQYWVSTINSMVSTYWYVTLREHNSNRYVHSPHTMTIVQSYSKIFSKPFGNLCIKVTVSVSNSIKLFGTADDEKHNFMPSWLNDIALIELLLTSFCITIFPINAYLITFRVLCCTGTHDLFHELSDTSNPVTSLISL